jgi:diacylglycerol O-acyltransferase / wax synthase
MLSPAMASARLLSGADHTLLRIGDRQNLIVPLALVFSAELSRAAVRENLEKRLAPFHQFTHRIERRWLSAHWVLDKAFSIDNHLRELRLPPGSGSKEFRDWLSREITKPLDNKRPLWQATLVHNIDSCSALLMRVHHSLADGMSLMNLVSCLTDVAQGMACVEPARSSARKDLSVGVVLRHAPRVIADVLQMIFMRKDQTNQLRGALGADKSVAWSEALPLASTRDMAHRHHATANDVMLAVVAAALRQYLLAQKQMMIAGPMLVAIPINIRSRGDKDHVGNRFGLVGLELPVHLADPLERLHAVRDAMVSLKHGFQGELASALMRCASVLPPSVQRPVLGFLLHRCSAVITNVIGPAEERMLGGVRMDQMIGFVPPMAVGVGVSILSYNNSVRICFLVDNKLMPDCLTAAASIRGCFDELRRAYASTGG